MAQNNARRRGSPPKPPVRRNPHRPKRRRHHYKLLTSITFLFLMAYLCGHIIRFMNKPSIGVETVNFGTVDVPKVLDGIIVRDEYVAKSEMKGQAVYNFSEKEKVKKGAVICSIKDANNTDSLEEQIQDIDSSILEIQKNRSDLSIFQEDINDIQKKITNAVNSSTYKFIDGDFSEVYSFKNQIETQMNRRNQIWLLENNQSMSELSAEKTQYEAQLANYISSMSAEFSGVLAFSVDGFEEKLTPDTLDTVTKEQTKMTIKPEYISKSQPMEEESPAFKIVKSNVFYIASYVPNDLCAGWDVGDSKTLTMTVEEEQKQLDVSIERINPGEKETYIVFESDVEILDFLDIRSISFTVNNDVFNGIKIPNNAIIEKTLLKIPADCIIESVGERGVIKRVNKVDSFVNTKIIKTDDDDSNPETVEYAYVLQNFDTLGVGDIILQGTGETAKPYEITSVETYKGVYVVNSSIAKFTIIDSLGENDEYTVVKPSSGHYGLKAYDNIVSDAKNIQDSDIIY